MKLQEVVAEILPEEDGFGAPSIDELSDTFLPDYEDDPEEEVILILMQRLL